MAGQVLELLPRTAFDFTFLAVSSSQARVLVGNIPTVQYSTGTLMVRVHNMDFTNGAKITVGLSLDMSTPSDPEHSFVESAAIAGASIDVDAQSVEGATETSSITGDLGYKVALGVIGTMSTNPGHCQAEISVLLVLKDNA